MPVNLHPENDDWSVDILRTGVFFVALDLEGNVHLGVDAFNEVEDCLTLPGGGIEPSDRNLYKAGKRETGQEFGKHMHYELIDPRPLVILNSMEDDSVVRTPSPNQKVKLRVGFIVMETGGNLPREQRRKEVLDPRPYRITRRMLEKMNMRESSRELLRRTFERGILPKPRYKPGVKADFEDMRAQMEALHVPRHVRDYHCNRVVRRSRPGGKLAEGSIDDYLKRLGQAEKQHRKLKRHERRNRLQKVDALVRLVTVQCLNRETRPESERKLAELVEKLDSRDRRS